ncbi:stalk domain-containing protein [Schinkia sp. CFF1]
MKKLFLAIILLFSLAAPSFAQAASSTSSLVLMVNNKLVTNSPFISDGTTYVPLNEIAEQMGEEVDSISYQKKVVIQGGNGFVASVSAGQTIGVVNGSLYPLKTKTINGEQVNANIKAIYENDQVYVPVEFIASGKGMTYPVEIVNDDAKTTIYIGEIPSTVKNEIANRPIVLMVNNKQVPFSPFISEGTTYVPLYEVAKQMGGNPESYENKVQVELNGLTFATVTAGESAASIYYSQLNSRDRTRIVPLKTKIVNGNTEAENAKAIYKNGQIFVPIEFLSSADGLHYYVETVKEKEKTTIYVGALPPTLQEPINNVGYATKWAIVTPAPESITNVTGLVQNQQVFIYGAQGNWYKIKVGNHIGYVKKDVIKIGKTPAKGKMYADGWVAPTLKSKWNKDPQVNYKTLQNELGFTHNGAVFDIFGAVRGIEVVYDGSQSQEVGMSFFLWKDPSVEQSYRIPIVAKELFKLYFGQDADRVWNYFNRDDIPEKFTANGRTVKAQYVSATGSIYLQVGYKK